MKRFVVLFLMLLLSLSAVEAKENEIAGNIYYTDIKVSMYSAPVNSYNIGGKTVIDAESLNWHYGFDVYWLEEERKLDITDKGGVFVSLQALAGETIEKMSGNPGDIAGNYYYTDIKTYLNGKEIESYNIGGRTFIVAEEMRNYGYNVDWNEDKRELKISKKGDFYVAETELGSFKLMYNPVMEQGFVREFIRGPLLTIDENITVEELFTASNSVKSTMGGQTFVLLSDLTEAFGAECYLTEDTVLNRTEFINDSEYEYESYKYTIVFNFDTRLKPETRLSLLNYDYKDLNDKNNKFEEITDISMSINGHVYDMTGMYGGKTYDSPIIVQDGKVYIPVHMASYMYGSTAAY